MKQPGFATRRGLAFGAFFKILFDGAFAAAYQQIGQPSAPSQPAIENDTVPMDSVAPLDMPTTVEAPTLVEAPKPGRHTLQFLGALQREGRFVDFLMEELDGAQDADIGAAARVVHSGCRRILNSYLTIDPIWPGDEGSQVTVDEGFNPLRIQLTGQVTGSPPFSGTLQHRGWHATSVNLPELSDESDPAILAPAEVEL